MKSNSIFECRYVSSKNLTIHNKDAVMNEQIFSTKVSSKARDYFFDVKQSQNGTYYLTINESRKSEDGSTKRQCVLIFNNLLSDFAAAFAQSMSKISQLDPSIIWDPRNTHNKQDFCSIQNHSQAKAKYREMTKEEIQQQQKLNLRNGKPKNSGLRWNNTDRSKIKQLHKSGNSIVNIAESLQRSNSSIIAELKKQGLLDDSTHLQKLF